MSIAPQANSRNSHLQTTTALPPTTGSTPSARAGSSSASEEPLLEQALYPYDIKVALQHQDTALVGKAVAVAVAVRNKEWTFVYRLYEPSELYSRVDDPWELHSLANVAEHAEVRRRMEAKAKPEDPKSQWEKRGALAGVCN
ncbi:hypothetical protein VMCG_00311 [Cytospora schulzeri]|uniref:Uncharacterized protein n=1 Tax=Cytospora schulzeri TaxID=448051 RepID=A0A423X9D8_9PEZI|nr:hypothetical protein VMCG_00311 [Valsa malicola]